MERQIANRCGFVWIFCIFLNRFFHLIRVWNWQLRMCVKVRLNDPNSILSATLPNTLMSIIAKEVRKRRILVLYAIMRKLQENKKRPYRKKQYWVAPYLKDRPEHSFYHVSIPKLTVEDGLRFQLFPNVCNTIGGIVVDCWAAINKTKCYSRVYITERTFGNNIKVNILNILNILITL